MDDSISAETPVSASEELRPVELPDGEYAIVEIMGHRTMIGRIAEVERFGAKLCAIEPLFAGELLPAVLVGGASIYQLTPCSAATALKRQPKHAWQLPPSVSAGLPDAMLPAPLGDNSDDECDDDGMPF